MARRTAWRQAAAAAFGFWAALQAGDAAAQTVDRSCLWRVLPTVDRLRLELAARSDEGLPPSVVERLGDEGLAEILGRCGMHNTKEEMAVMARYWVARAKLEVAEVELRLVGVSLARADGALLVTAPTAERMDLALEIIEKRDDMAGPSIRAAIQTLDIVGPPLNEEQKQRLAEYFSAKLIADGLAAGATPPLEEGEAVEGAEQGQQ